MIAGEVVVEVPTLPSELSEEEEVVVVAEPVVPLLPVVELAPPLEPSVIGSPVVVVALPPLVVVEAEVVEVGVEGVELPSVVVDEVVVIGIWPPEETTIVAERPSSYELVNSILPSLVSVTLKIPGFVRLPEKTLDETEPSELFTSWEFPSLV